jgi:hypothetical protein
MVPVSKLSLEADRGMMILDVVHDQIVFVEVLYRDDVRAGLTAVLP